MQLSFNIKGTLLDLTEPRVMGILNTTTDSFFDGGLHTTMDNALYKVEAMLRDGAYIIDVGGYSSRPGADEVPISLELDRVVPVVEAIKSRFEVFISVDTFRAEVARQAVNAGALIVNDISAGDDDEAMLATIGELEVAYIYMHKQGNAKTMQINPHYEDVVSEVYDYLEAKAVECRKHGIFALIADPGFGFGKTVEHNYSLLRNLERFQNLDVPLLTGISRKSLINKVLGTKPQNALNGTTFLHAFCLQGGAKILRVHDVKEAMQCVALWNNIRS